MDGDRLAAIRIPLACARRSTAAGIVATGVAIGNAVHAPVPPDRDARRVAGPAAAAAVAPPGCTTPTLARPGAAGTAPLPARPS